MSDTYFPTMKGITWNAVKRPKFSSKVAEYVSGKEIRVSNYANPVWEWDMSFEFLRADTTNVELQTLMGFYLARRGCFDSFLFVDPSELNTVTLYTLGAGDGININFQTTKTFGGFIEPVGYCFPSSLHVFFTTGGVTTQQMSGWTLNSTNQITFTVPPPIGTDVKATYTWFYRVRFGDDSQDYSNFMYQLWELKKLSLHATKI